MTPQPSQAGGKRLPRENISGTFTLQRGHIVIVIVPPQQKVHFIIMPWRQKVVNNNYIQQTPQPSQARGKRLPRENISGTLTLQRGHINIVIMPRQQKVHIIIMPRQPKGDE